MPSDVRHPKPTYVHLGLSKVPQKMVCEYVINATKAEKTWLHAMVLDECCVKKDESIP
jgi:hypothetical protein